MAIQRQEGSFPSADGKHKTAYSHWFDDEQQPRAALQLVHGMAEYIDRYDAFARFMVQLGYTVYGHDHLGHGRTAESPAEHGYFACKDGYKLLVEDTHGMTQIVRTENPGIPNLLLGHSMGSMVVRLYADSYSDEIDGLIIMGTSGSNPAAGAGLLLGRLTGLLRGKAHPSPMIDRIGFGAFSRRIEGARTPLDWLSTDSAQVDKYIADEKCGFPFTAAGYVDLFSLLRAVSRPAWGDGIRKDLPVLVISGGDDPVGDYGKGVRAVYDQLAQKGITDLELEIYPSMRHEILNEKDKGTVFLALANWCDRVALAEKP